MVWVWAWAWGWGWMESLYRAPGEHHHVSDCTAVASSDA